MIEIAYSQHCGNNPDQQDALWNGKRVFQQRNLPTGQRALDGNERGIVAVADGVANSPVPQRASRCVLETLAAEVAAGAVFDVRLVRRVHGRLCDVLAKGRIYGSSTTLAALECRDDRCVVLSVGDSRVYRIDAKGDWKQLSRDHTVLNALIDSGEAEAEGEYASFYHMLASSLVADDTETEFPVHRAEAPFRVGDALLLCTDGVHDTLGDVRLAQLTDLSLAPSAQVEQWRQAVLKAGAPDNFSLIFLRRYT